MELLFAEDLSSSTVIVGNMCADLNDPSFYFYDYCPSFALDLSMDRALAT